MVPLRVRGLYSRIEGMKVVLHGVDLQVVRTHFPSHNIMRQSNSSGQDANPVLAFKTTGMDADPLPAPFLLSS